MKPLLIASLLAGLASVAFSKSDTFVPSEFKCRNNLEQTPIGVSGHWSIEKLLALTQEEGLQLWRSAAAVPLKEMNGHYLGFIPGVRRDLHAEENSVYGGFWLGKAFRPTSESSGEGYNRFRSPDGRILRTSRFVTRIGKSLVDGKPAFIIDYSTFDKSITVIDDLRKLEKFAYLGIATADVGGGKRSEPQFWVLIGPTDDWVGPDPVQKKPNSPP
jgi:hypothetical protein